MYRMYGISDGMDAKERICLLEIEWDNPST